MLKEDSYHRRLILEECGKFGFTPRIVFSSNQIQTIKGLVANGVGVSFFFSMAARDNSRIVCIPLENPLKISIGLAWKRISICQRRLRPWSSSLRSILGHRMGTNFNKREAVRCTAVRISPAALSMVVNDIPPWGTIIPLVMQHVAMLSVELIFPVMDRDHGRRFSGHGPRIP